jgi:hypothetical protein
VHPDLRFQMTWSWTATRLEDYAYKVVLWSGETDYQRGFEFYHYYFRLVSPSGKAKITRSRDLISYCDSPTLRRYLTRISQTRKHSPITPDVSGAVGISPASRAGC